MLSRLRLFMAGRSGMDNLSGAILIAALLINWLCGIANLVWLSVLPAAMVTLALFRVLSRNVVKRREENYRFVNCWKILKVKFSDWRERCRQSKSFKFFSCPGCKNRLRVPRGKGRLQITCPRCGQRFGGKT